jgi:putative transposase
MGFIQIVVCMTRPLRIDVADGWYHVTTRGIDRGVIFGNTGEHGHFGELLGEMVDRFRVVLGFAQK